MTTDRYQPLFTLSPELVSLVEVVGEALGRASVLKDQTVRLRKTNRIRTIQGSVAIEGNTLTEAQVTAVLEGKRVLAPPREIIEVQNALKAYERLEEWNPQNEADLLTAHAVMMDGLLDRAGKYRGKGAGIMGREGIIHVAPPADRVPYLVRQLLHWLETTSMPPVIAGAVFHYEFEFIHPFVDGNGRMGRLWQTLILSRWNSIFSVIPVESVIHLHQPDYYAAINQSTAGKNCAPFVEFMLKIILETLTTDQAGDQVSDQVGRLLAVMDARPAKAVELMGRLGLSHRPTFRKNYLHPALENGLVEMTRPDAPQAKNQEYRLTGKGKGR